jgi:carboxylesterase type B
MTSDGGGYGTGQGNGDLSELVMTNNHGFIVVVIQYRLGAYGFLSSAELSHFGIANAGLYDMHFSLQWVQDHIRSFGGDPSRVTIVRTIELLILYFLILSLLSYHPVMY